MKRHKSLACSRAFIIKEEVRNRTGREFPCALSVPLSLTAGEACQFDRSHKVVLMRDVTVTVAHVRLCHSRFTSGRLPLQGRLHPGHM